MNALLPGSGNSTTASWIQIPASQSAARTMYASFLNNHIPNLAMSACWVIPRPKPRRQKKPRKPIIRRKPLRAKRKADPRMAAMYPIVLRRYQLSYIDRYRCHHCGYDFPRNSICLDHFPFTKKAWPELRYDPTNLVACCQACNTSGSYERSASMKHWRLTGRVVPVWEHEPSMLDE